MNKKISLLCLILLCCLAFAGCGEDPKITKFQDEINSFCSSVAAIDTAINNIDAESETAKDELLENLDMLAQSFQELSEITVPEEYSYIEELADEASEYMTTAVNAYHEAFSNSSYNEYTAEYARQNYERAYKRVTVILKLLRGEEITDADVTVEEVEE